MIRHRAAWWTAGALLLAVVAAAAGLRCWAASGPRPTSRVSGVVVGRVLTARGIIRWQEYRLSLDDDSPEVVFDLPLPFRESEQLIVLRDDDGELWLTREFSGVLGERVVNVPAWPAGATSLPRTTSVRREP